ncbi:MAG: ribonuclease HII, partial [Actinobacteria bacterium]|nr:ribonuclease HII [Actinomycetota bacterium]
MIEDKIWLEDPNKYIIGADEVGRGSFAGPICASA